IRAAGCQSHRGDDAPGSRPRTDPCPRSVPDRFDRQTTPGGSISVTIVRFDDPNSGRDQGGGSEDDMTDWRVQIITPQAAAPSRPTERPPEDHHLGGAFRPLARPTLDSPADPQARDEVERDRGTATRPDPPDPAAPEPSPVAVAERPEAEAQGAREPLHEL